jgi:hypothetical protein
MEPLTEPKQGGGRRALAVALLLGLVGASFAIWLLARRPAEAPDAPPRARSSPTPRATASAPARAEEARTRPEPTEAAAPAPSLRVDSDVPGATVFLDRKFLGTTPVETRAFEPGTHRLNVSAEGYEMYAESVDLAAGTNKVTVRFKEVRLDERVAVAHKHGVGACHGVLHASTAGLRFEADKPGDSFEAPFGVLEPLQVDYLAKNLRVKRKGGRTWNFTSDNADALLAFQKAVEAARARL